MASGAIATKFDPWGPVSTILYGISDSDFLQDAIANTGISIDWVLTPKQQYSHTTRVRAMRQLVDAAYKNLEQNTKGLFAQIVVKAILRRHDGPALRALLLDALHDIGWTITNDGLLRTDDALVSELFFPPNSTFDAYTAIRDILASAKQSIGIVDPYVGSSLLLTLRALDPRPLTVRLLTVRNNLRSDFAVALQAFRAQVLQTTVEIRTTRDFHDRFIVIDGAEVYHVGASLKDAGTRAFMINRLQDSAIVESVRREIQVSWNAAAVL